MIDMTTAPPVAGPSRPRHAPSARAIISTPLVVLSAILLAAVSVIGHPYNETLDPWNINKNQSESLQSLC